MITILFEDEFIIAVHKPSGLPSHSLKTPSEDSCETRLKAKKPGVRLVHRLDTGTSGVLVFAKTAAVYEQMRSLFKARAVQKYYQAWVVPPAHEGTVEMLKSHLPYKIKVPLAHSPKSKKRMIVVPEGSKRDFRGKPIPAVTIIYSIEPDYFEDAEALRVNLEIVTGVMHQIRVHMKHLGLPLMGDRIYGDPETRENQSRLALHAQRIVFTLNGKPYQIECEI